MIRALVVGYGSIGSRHARVLDGMGAEVAVVSRRPGVHERTFGTAEQAIREFDPDYAVICNETTHHRAALGELAEAGFSGAVLVEKPLWNPADPVFDPGDLDISVAYLLRFDPILRELRHRLQGKRLLTLDVRCGSYLPAWRPGRDYRETSSARSEAGGGVLRDLSHELDYVLWLCGGWTRLTASGGHISPLEIDTEDAFMILARTERCPLVSISLNYLDRQEDRTLIVTTDDSSYRADLVLGRLFENGELVLEAVETTDRLLELQHEDVLNHGGNCCSFAEGLDVVDVIAAAEDAGVTGKWVHQ